MKKIGFTLDRGEPAKSDVKTNASAKTKSRLSKDGLEDEMERLKRAYNVLDMANDSLIDGDRESADELYAVASKMMKRAYGGDKTPDA